MKQILSRFTEPSTWTALGGLALALGLSTEDWTSYSSLGIAIASFVAGMVLKEKGEVLEKKDEDQPETTSISTTRESEK